LTPPCNKKKGKKKKLKKKIRSKLAAMHHMIVTGLLGTVTFKRGARFSGLKRTNSLGPKTLFFGAGSTFTLFSKTNWK
jgi:hypothetical protein